MKQKRLKQFIFILLIFVGILSRVLCCTKISEINSDEIVTIVNAKSIADTGKSLDNITMPIYLNGWGGQSVALLYLMVLSIKIFGYHLFSARFPIFIISILSLFVMYDFVKKMTLNNDKYPKIEMLFLKRVIL